MADEFVDGWLVAQLLGEGAYGEVRLLVHGETGARVALKAARGDGAAAGAREAALHRALRHPHVLRCLGARAHLAAHYTFLEYAAGGELFERIEPDAGVRPAGLARRYWRQLLLGLRYLHERGVAHRDIKPENLLLDAHDRLKISDFGMATVFRAGARERLLTRVCGTLPYAAPEVLRAAAAPYRAPPADVWAAGVVLYAMLTGELPWERAHEDDARYAAWSRGDTPARLAGPERALLRRVLREDAARRAAPPALLRLADGDADEAGASRSQPAGAGAAGPAPLSAAAMDALAHRSQPAHAHELLLSPSGGAPRMTRVWVRGAGAGALHAAAAALCGAGLCARAAPPALHVECERELHMRAHAVRQAPAATLLEFRRWRGCGMLFRRRFLTVRDALLPLAPPNAPAD